MTFLDTVDGKLARTTLTSSKWGDYFDHGIDLIHPPFWYVAWGYGLLATGTQWSNEVFWSVMVAILGGYILQRVIEGIAIKWLGLEIHIWRPIDTLFRQITARRNPNLVIADALHGHCKARLGPDGGCGLDGDLPRPSRAAVAAGVRRKTPQRPAHVVDDQAVKRAGLLINPSSGKSSGKGLSLVDMLKNNPAVSIRVLEKFEQLHGLYR